MRKKLLSEAQVRRFQSLASIKPLNEMDSSYKKHDDEDKMEEAYGDEAAMKDDEPMEGLYEEEDEEMGEEGMDEADVELDEELVEKFMEAAATIQEVSDALGGGAGGDMDDDMDMGGDEPADDMDMDMGGDEPEAEEGGDDEEMALQEALRGINYVPSQKEIVKTVAQRVAKRLQEAKQAQARLNRALGKRY
tara:strand:- start:1173 stop:1748 length:576 start_codon:yes stop_codon:yes gene_type:complete